MTEPVLISAGMNRAEELTSISAGMFTRCSTTRGKDGVTLAARGPTVKNEHQSPQGYRKVGRPSAPVQEPTGADSKNPDFIARRSLRILV